MPQLNFRITTLSPVMLSSSGGVANMVNSKDFIPGSIIRGLFAGEYTKKAGIEQNAHKDANFYKWFLSGVLSFGNAYIESKTHSQESKVNFPLPFSIQHQKNDDNNVYDLLYETPDSRAPTKPFGGYGRLDGVSPRLLRVQEVQILLNFHHGRDPETGTPAAGIFFNYEAIAPRQSFQGNIIGEKSDLDTIRSLFHGKSEYFIGRSRSNQYGRIHFSFLDGSGDSEIARKSLDISEGEISVTLTSHTIINNQNGFASTEAKNILKELNFGQNVTIRRPFIKTGEIENFVSVWKLRRPSTSCFLAGSCFLLSGLENTEQNKRRILEIEKNGIGERRLEGFGRLVFGWQWGSKIELAQKSIQEKTIQLTESISNKFISIATDLVRQKLKKQARVHGIRSAERFNSNIPTRSLIGRLESAAIKGYGIEEKKSEFLTTLNKLRISARNQLEKCQADRVTLFQFLNNEEEDPAFIQSIISDFDDLTHFLNEDQLGKNIIQKIGSDMQFNRNLRRLFWQSFFSLLRHRSKQIEAGVNA